MSTDRDALRAIIANLDHSIANAIVDKEEAKAPASKALCDRALVDLDRAKLWAVNKLKSLPCCDN
jgi:hypothetical protein